MLIVLSAMAAGVAVVSVLVCLLMTLFLQERVRVNRDRGRQQILHWRIFVVECVP